MFPSDEDSYSSDKGAVVFQNDRQIGDLTAANLAEYESDPEEVGEPPNEEGGGEEEEAAAETAVPSRGRELRRSTRLRRSASASAELPSRSTREHDVREEVPRRAMSVPPSDTPSNPAVINDAEQGQASSPAPSNDNQGKYKVSCACLSNVTYYHP